MWTLFYRPIHGLIFLFKWVPDNESSGNVVQDNRLDKIFFAKQVWKFIPFILTYLQLTSTFNWLNIFTGNKQRLCNTSYFERPFELQTLRHFFGINSGWAQNFLPIIRCQYERSRSQQFRCHQRSSQFIFQVFRFIIQPN